MPRRAGPALALAAVLATLAAAPAAPAAEARPYLPDLDQQTPYAIALEKRDRRLLLVFGSATVNVGLGPFLVTGRRVGPGAVMRTWQIVRRTNGTGVRRLLGDLLMYEYADTHEHWHLHGFARYELRSVDTPGTVFRSRKQGFCLGDRFDADPTRRLRREPRRPVWTHDCGLGETGRLRIAEGISVGYGDDYAPGLEGQYVDVTGLPAGRYFLVHRANPAGTIRELDAENNAAAALVELRRPEGGAPSVRIVKHCPDRPRC